MLRLLKLIPAYATIAVGKLVYIATDSIYTIGKMMQHYWVQAKIIVKGWTLPDTFTVLGLLLGNFAWSFSKARQDLHERIDRREHFIRSPARSRNPYVIARRYVGDYWCTTTTPSMQGA